MAHAVFLRAANVGGRNVFRPAQLAAALAHHDVVNVGAAGTFVVRGGASAATLRKELVAALPFTLDLAIVPARDVLELVASAPFTGVVSSQDQRAWVAWLCAKPRAVPELPFALPPGPAWAMRVDRIGNGFALGIFRRQPRPLYPNAVVEKALGVPATTRWWDTVEKVAALLEGGRGGPSPRPKPAAGRTSRPKR